MFGIWGWRRLELPGLHKSDRHAGGFGIKMHGKMQMFDAEKFQMFLHGSLALHLYVGLVIPNV